MLTRYIPNPEACADSILHNTRHWQVTELMGGLACELLLKERDIAHWQQQDSGLSLHACYPSMFMQGEAATQFMAELAEAKQTSTNVEVDRLFLAEYRPSLTDLH